jgi:hypothetical protein
MLWLAWDIFFNYNFPEFTRLRQRFGKSQIILCKAGVQAQQPIRMKRRGRKKMQHLVSIACKDPFASSWYRSNQPITGLCSHRIKPSSETSVAQNKAVPQVTLIQPGTEDPGRCVELISRERVDSTELACGVGKAMPSQRSDV